VANPPLIPILCIAVRKLSGAVGLVAATTALALVVPGGISTAQTIAPKPNLTTLVAQAKQLEFQINALSEQYDGLRLQLTRAKANERIAQQAASRGAAALAVGQQAVAQLAAANYMNSGLDPTFQALTAGDPRQFLSQASTIAELNQSSGVKVSTLSNQVNQALRDKQTADQQIAAVNALQAQMDAKKKIITAKIDKVNSAAMKQAMAVFEQTGHYPTVSIPTANTVGAQALQAALTRAGDPYVWGAAGPSAFDCSGLVVWAYAQEGIALPHYTGSLWNSGVHVARQDLEPGDLVFFGADISHVGIYVGEGMMIDAPNFGVPVHVEPIFSGYIGAVRIA
jgi:peptidoglycan DL-endopeptidase CwlO